MTKEENVEDEVTHHQLRELEKQKLQYVYFRRE